MVEFWCNDLEKLMPVDLVLDNDFNTNWLNIPTFEDLMSLVVKPTVIYNDFIVVLALI